MAGATTEIYNGSDNDNENVYDSLENDEKSITLPKSIIYDNNDDNTAQFYSYNDDIINDENNDINNINNDNNMDDMDDDIVDDDDDDDDSNDDDNFDDEYSDDNIDINNINIYNRPISGLRIHDDNITGITTGNHNPLISSVGDDYRLVLYKINSEHRLQCIKRIKKKYLPLDISFDNSGQCLAIAMIDGVIEVWDIKTMKPIYTLKGHTGSVLKVKWSLNDRNTLVSYANDKTVRIWHPHSPPSTRNDIKKILPNSITDIDWQKGSALQGPILGCVDKKGTLRMFDSKKNYDVITTRNSMGTKLSFGYNSLITLNGYELNLFDVSKQERVKRIKSKFHNNSLINDICLSYESLYTNDDSKASFVTIDQHNLLNLWQFTDDLNNAKCNGIIKDCHNINDKNVYSNLKIINNKPVPKSKPPSIPIQIGSNNTENKNNNNDNNINNINNIDDENESIDETSYVTNIEFCRHVPQYLLTTGKDGTVKLWDTQHIHGNIKSNKNGGGRVVQV